MTRKIRIRFYIAVEGEDAKLLKHWAEYKKPINTHTLDSKFLLEDLLRAARWDEDIKNLLSAIGLDI